MTLVWPDPAALGAVNGPRLHAFVIGVADYPHLTKGSGARAVDPLGLTQLSTPHYTASAIVDWLIDEYRHPTVPLGSVEMLLSPANGVATPRSATPTRATMAAIRSSFGAWVQRCNTDPGNIALFYFVGHGVEKVEQYLLPEDFGDPALPNGWANCVNFSAMHMGMRSCRAQTQVFFVDACRETPFGMLATLTPQGDPLISATTAHSVTSSSVYRATTEGKRAFGPRDDVSYFGQAVLACLRGLGSMHHSGAWLVDTASLGNGLAHKMAQLARKAEMPLQVHPSPQGLVTIAQAPKPRVRAVIECSSPSASKASEITLQNAHYTWRSPCGDPRPIDEELDGGDWSITVSFPNNEFPNKVISDRFTPPAYFGVPAP